MLHNSVVWFIRLVVLQLLTFDSFYWDVTIRTA
jgi:hypothetical protein